VDLVGADRAPVARRLLFAGSIKWNESTFDRHNLNELTRSAVQVPGFTLGETGLAIVSLNGTDPSLTLATVDLTWGPEEIISAWAPTP
jgi:hypothetical protein